MYYNLCGPDPFGFGRLNFIGIDKIRNLQDDAFDEALKKYVVATLFRPMQ